MAENLLIDKENSQEKFYSNILIFFVHFKILIVLELCSMIDNLKNFLMKEDAISSSKF